MDSIFSAVPDFGRIVLSLDDLCKYVQAHDSLQQAEVVATECYTEDAGPVTHRFLVLELQRPARKDLFLRLDRRREEGISIRKFVLNLSLQTKANDLVS